MISCNWTCSWLSIVIFEFVCIFNLCVVHLLWFLPYHSHPVPFECPNSQLMSSEIRSHSPKIPVFLLLPLLVLFNFLTHNNFDIKLMNVSWNVWNNIWVLSIADKLKKKIKIMHFRRYFIITLTIVWFVLLINVNNSNELKPFL